MLLHRAAQSDPALPPAPAAMALRRLPLALALLAPLAAPLRTQAVRGEVVDDAARPVAAARPGVR